MSIEELQSTLTFSNLCDLIKKEMPLSILLTDNNGKKEILKLNQAEIVGLVLGFRDKYMYSIMLDDKESFRSFHPSLSQYKNGKTPIPIEVRNAYGDESQKNELHKYIKETFIDNMENPGAFKEELCELINNVPDNSWKNTLLEEKDVTVLLSKALGITMNARLHMQYLKQENKKKKEKTVLAFNQKNKNNCDKISPTHSITITIAGTELPNDIVFHNIDDAILYCTKNNYLINYLLSLSSTAHIVYVQKSNYGIRKLTLKEFPVALDFLELYKSEFRPKSFWPEYNISKLCEEGLNSGIWTAYGCFDGDRLIGYIDYKITWISGIEIGTELVDPQYREQSIATALINLIRLQYSFLPTFSGTYEENENMIKTFKVAGYNVDVSKGRNGLIKERIDITHPNEDEFTTNSIYFIAEPFLDGYAK